MPGFHPPAALVNNSSHRMQYPLSLAILRWQPLKGRFSWASVSASLKRCPDTNLDPARCLDTDPEAMP